MDKKTQRKPGERLGPYEIVRHIAEGGFGYTYEARHRYFGGRACLKECSTNDSDLEKLLEEEAKLLWQIHHHSLPTLRDYFPTKEGSSVLVMSFIEGKNLQQSVEKHTAIHPEDVAWITQRVLNALHYLHSKGIIHGDVKPPNIIVQPEEHNAVLEVEGSRLIMQEGPKRVIGPGESVNIPHPSLQVEGFLTEMDKQYR